MSALLKPDFLVKKLAFDPVLGDATGVYSHLTTPQQHFDLLHAQPVGDSIVWERLRPAGKQWRKLSAGSIEIPAILAEQHNRSDRYLTVNEFFNWRRVSLLKSLRSLYVDLDYKLAGRELRLDEVLDALSDAKLPRPTFVMMSGRGWHLYWTHNPTSKKTLPDWQLCQDTINQSLRGIGADPAARDCARVLRMAGTKHSTAGTVTRGLVLDPAPYDFDHLCDEVVGARKPWAEPKQQLRLERQKRPPADVQDLSIARAKRGQGVRRDKSIYRWWDHVYTDLMTIGTYYDVGGVPEGYRDTWLHLSAVALTWFADPETARGELADHARRWTPGSGTDALLRNEIG